MTEESLAARGLGREDMCKLPGTLFRATPALAREVVPVRPYLAGRTSVAPQIRQVIPKTKNPPR